MGQRRHLHTTWQPLQLRNTILPLEGGASDVLVYPCILVEIEDVREDRRS
jgi:hypothetical protein